MTAGPSTAMQSSVLVLNRLYMAIQVMSVRRAFCLLFKDLAEVINIENGKYVSYDFENWRQVSQWNASLEGPSEHEDWSPAVNFHNQVPGVIRLLTYNLFQ